MTKAILIKPIKTKYGCRHVKNGCCTVNIESMIYVPGWSVTDIGICTKCNKPLMQVGDNKAWIPYEAKVIDIK